MKFKDRDLIGLVIALGILSAGRFLLPERIFPLIAGLGIVFGALPILIRLMRENKIAQEKESMFLEFARNLVESVKAGTPISKSIIIMADKNYGVLSQHIKKLGNQISLGIPLNTALQIFSKDADNRSISRSLTLIGQAEKAGGEIGEILEAVADAVSMTDRLKKERKSVISSLVSQGYIIFLVFIIIILVLQFQIIPMVSGIGSIGGTLEIGTGLSPVDPATSQNEIASAFLYLILVQGFFTGITIGKLSEGSFKAGIKHSFSLMFLSFIISTLANLFFGA
ncbi:type II secretion system F family protein [Candidatus Pacearchaeota archaeon]|nr:type II secretion system F family protein [Candidatus Pacearchaeota archaeon]